MYTYYIGIGSNLGDRESYLTFAISELTCTEGVHSVAHSSWIETPPWGPVEQGPFLNGIVKVVSSIEPVDMLDTILHIERLAGRQREIHWGPRTLDLDRVNEHRLVVPHPYFWERLFVLEPLQEVYPDFSYQGVPIRVRLEELRSVES